MLTVTEAAARAINSLVTKNQMPESAGLRIVPQSKTSRSEGMALSIAARPADDDTVLEAPDGAKVFLPVSVVYDLHEQQLDVEVLDNGDPHFFVERRRE
ncbi:MAG: iron-sulfur cluster biosynthesis protein [Pseudonocardiaceae bacterium]